MSTAATQTPFGLRMPQDLKSWVQDQAELKERSMNWVIVKIIERAKKEEEAKQ